MDEMTEVTITSSPHAADGVTVTRTHIHDGARSERDRFVVHGSPGLAILALTATATALARGDLTGEFVDQIIAILSEGETDGGVWN